MTSLLLGAPTADAPFQAPDPSPDQEIELLVVDTSAYPTVVVDLIVPPQHSAIDITETMVDVDGAPVESVAPVDPNDVAVALVIDDRPAIEAEAIASQQSGAVELARNTGDGTAIAVATPSGMQTTFTTDRAATIARVSGITAGAPDVTPLPDLILDSTALLASDDRTDRHLVLMLAATPQLSGSQFQQLAEALAMSRARLHVIAPPGVDVSPLDGLADLTGGSAPDVAETVAGADAVTMSIVNRYRITATVDGPGPHEFGLDVDGQRLASSVGINVATPPTTPAPTTAAPSTGPPSTAAPGTSATTAATATSAVGTIDQALPAPNTPVASTTPAGSATPAVAPSRTADAISGSSPVTLITAAIIVLAAGALALYVLWQQRRRQGAKVPSPVVRSPAVGSTTLPAPSPTALPEPTPVVAAGPGRRTQGGSV